MKTMIPGVTDTLIVGALAFMSAVAGGAWGWWLRGLAEKQRKG